MKRIPIGLKDYKKLKDENYYVVDKSLMTKEYMDRGSEVTLITRPRRFHPKYCRYLWYPTKGALVAGKTINMSRRCPPMACLRSFLILRKTPERYSKILLSCIHLQRMK